MNTPFQRIRGVFVRPAVDRGEAGGNKYCGVYLVAELRASRESSGGSGCGGREGASKGVEKGEGRVTYLQHAGGTGAFTRVNRPVYLFYGVAPSSFPAATWAGEGACKQRYVT